MPAAKKAATKKIPVPKTLGACADRLWTIEHVEVPKLERQLKPKLDALHAEYQAIEAHLIESLPKSQAGGITGKLGRAEIDRKVVPTVKAGTGWTALYKHIKQTGDFDLLQKRLSTTAVVERWNDKRAVPGVERFNVVKVKLTSLKAR